MASSLPFSFVIPKTQKQPKNNGNIKHLPRFQFGCDSSCDASWGLYFIITVFITSVLSISFCFAFSLFLFKVLSSCVTSQYLSVNNLVLVNLPFSKSMCPPWSLSVCCVFPVFSLCSFVFLPLSLGLVCLSCEFTRCQINHCTEPLHLRC